MTSFPSTVTESPSAPEPSQQPSEGLTDDAMKAEMSAVYDAKNGPEARAAEFVAQPPMPVYRGPEKRSIEETMSDAYDWAHEPDDPKAAEEKRDTQFWVASAHQAVDNAKRDAAKFNLTPEQYINLKQQGQQPAQVPQQWAALSERVAKSAPGTDPHAASNELWDLHDAAVKDPEAGLQAIAERLGATDQLAKPFHDVHDRYRDSFRDVPAVEAFEKLAAANDYLEREPVNGINWLVDAYGVTLEQLAAARAGRTAAPVRRAPQPSQRVYRPGENLRARMAANWPGAR